VSELVEDIEHAPRGWLLEAAEHLSLVVRADHFTGSEWQGAALQDEAARDLDAVLVELGRRLSGA
jgi:hypothetical protein